jgi:hypothetical protein
MKVVPPVDLTRTLSDEAEVDHLMNDLELGVVLACGVSSAVPMQGQVIYDI